MHGVGLRSRVAVCQPFDPWAIGGVFRDAALWCGATVLPLGLNITDPSLWATLSHFDPTHLCGTASVLTRLSLNLRGAKLRMGQRERTIFHAGEPLTRAMRELCSSHWKSRTVNVYGSAEFDSIASEGLLEQGLILSPHLTFGLRMAGRRQTENLSPGDSGELLIKATRGSRWYATSDRIKVLGKADRSEPLWPGSWRVEHMGRTDSSFPLPDGSLVYGRQLQSIASEVAGVESLQLSLGDRASAAPVLEVRAAGVPGAERISVAKLKQHLLKECFEVADAVKHGVVRLRVRVVDISSLEHTARGKVRAFVEQ